MGASVKIHKKTPTPHSRGDLYHLLYTYFLQVREELLRNGVPHTVLRLPRRRDEHARRRALRLRCRAEVRLGRYVTVARNVP